MRFIYKPKSIIMLISNFNLCKSGWLELVFEKRNKAYGAYELRQHYSQNLAKALGISVVTIVGGALLIGSAITVKPVEANFRVVDIPKLVDLAKPKIDPPKPKTEITAPVQASRQVKTTRFVPPVITSEPVPDEMPNIDLLAHTAVGPANTEGEQGDNINIPEPVTGSGTGVDITESTEPHNIADLSVLPKPFGGDEGWSKFLHKNLRYPAQAVDAEKSGKVWISFIIEKDGSLTDITMLRGPGYGMNEEALRVLKLAPAWKPGIQNGHPVRVQYTIPINFALQ